ncbi:MAG: dipeptide epimerase [Alphaproteobacteria bacterium]|nr:dipeptide epimerase [Alphaproteobacteria bacterium]
MPTLTAEIETFPLRNRFAISRGSKTETVVVSARLTDGAIVGQGECGPNIRYGETPESVLEQILACSDDISGGLTRDALQDRMPAGAARNALDCALWDFEAKATGVPAWQTAGVDAPGPVTTAFTLSVDTPDAMAKAAAENADRPLLKLKLTGSDDLARVRAVRDAAPEAQLIVDANEAWDQDAYDTCVAAFVDMGVALIEQPFPADADAALAVLPRPIPVCADESFHDAASLEALVGKYDLVNIKLDKTGGLTEALRAGRAARELGFDIMVGCMVGTSLAMAPAFLVAAHARFVDLDGPLLLSRDRDPALAADRSRLSPPARELWG